MFESCHAGDPTTHKVRFKKVKEVSQNFAYQWNHASFNRIWCYFKTTWTAIQINKDLFERYY